MERKNKPKTRRVMDIELDDGTYIVCIKDNTQEYNPFRVYLKFWKDGGWHKRHLISYRNMNSVVYYLRDIIEGR